MPKKKRMLLMLLKGGMSQSDVAAIVHCSKRDVAAASKLIKTKGLTAAAVLALAESEAEELLAPKHKPREKNPDYLQPDVGSLVERKSKRRKLPIKLVWLEYCEQASRESKLAYSCQTFSRAVLRCAGQVRRNDELRAQRGRKGVRRLGW